MLLNKITSLFKWSSKTNSVSPGGEGENIISEISSSNYWITKLDINIQLRLALKLIDILLPELNKYAAKNVMHYTDAATGKHLTINNNFFDKTLQEIKNNASVIVLPDNIKYSHIKKCLDEFILPVAAMCDGDWIVPYSIKKIIMALFNILKGIEQAVTKTSSDYFCKSVSLSIEVIEFSRLQNMNELHLLLEEYKLLLPENVSAAIVTS